MSKLVDSRYFTGSAVEFVDGLDVFMPEKEDPEKRGQACGRVAEGPEGKTGSSWRCLRKREQRSPAGREKCRPGLRRGMSNSLSTQKQFLTLLGSSAFRVNF